jgi:hypothetical protein
MIDQKVISMTQMILQVCELQQMPILDYKSQSGELAQPKEMSTRAKRLSLRLRSEGYPWHIKVTMSSSNGEQKLGTGRVTVIRALNLQLG